MSEYCKESVYSSGGGRGGCSRKAVKDGYCKQHHPDSVKARRDKQNAKWRAEMESRRLVAERHARERAERDRKLVLYPDLVDALRIAEARLCGAGMLGGDDDPVVAALRKAGETP